MAVRESTSDRTRRTRAAARRARTIGAIGLAIILLAACGSGDERPSVADWSVTWSAVNDLPTAEAVLAADDHESVCEDALATVREARGDTLEPTPDEMLDEAVAAWARTAETYLFDCPADDEDRLRSLAAETAAARDEIDALIGRPQRS